jgi:formylglycine-generating enzyme required for sulfatase activity
MVVVPAGTYRVGGGVRAAKSVALDSFYIDSTEVTVGAYQAFVTADAAQRRTPPWRTPPDPQWPVTGVLWTEAQQFCAWRTGGIGALPTEDQWEAAARGPEGWTYPWGNGWEAGRANADSKSDSLTPVGRYPSGRSPVGAVDMVGNAWEWVDAQELGPPGDVRHIAKGGAFNTKPPFATTYFRSALPDDRTKIWLTGFRCARPLNR